MIEAPHLWYFLITNGKDSINRYLFYGFVYAQAYYVALSCTRTGRKRFMHMVMRTHSNEKFTGWFEICSMCQRWSDVTVIMEAFDKRGSTFVVFLHHERER